MANYPDDFDDSDYDEIESDEQLGYWEQCGRCEGSGRVPDAEPPHTLECPNCNGLGNVFWALDH